MTFSNKGFSLLKEVEDCKLHAYKDQAGVWTIGYGSTSNVCEGMVITQQEAETRLMIKVASVTNLINKRVKVNLTQNQFDALVVFVYNVGDGAFEKSHMLECINNGDFVGASNWFPKWDHVDGVENKGLLNRRLKEQALFNA